MISPYASLGEYCAIYHNVTIGANEHRNNYKNAPSIGKRVYIGAGATLIGNISIGDDVIVGTNATVSKDVPAGMIVIGNNNIVSGNTERNPHPCLSEKTGYSIIIRKREKKRNILCKFDKGIYTGLPFCRVAYTH